MGWTRHAKRWLTDRRGATSMEYALVAAILAPIVLAGFTVFYTRVDAVLAGISP